MPNVVSHCCQSGIRPAIRKEFPTGGSIFGQSYLVDVCEDCGKECDAVMTCTYCGAEATSESPTFYQNNEERCYNCAEEKEAVSA